MNMNMMRMKLLSRLTNYTALHGMTTKYKDYLSIPKHQGNEGLCWAYSLSSAIEMKYALESGNRLMLDPLTLKNNSANWFKKHDKHNKTYPSFCKQYGKDGGYAPGCAVLFMHDSKTTMMQQDGNDSYLYISNATYDHDINITTVKELYDALDKYQLLYSGIYADFIFNYKYIINEYYDENESIDHAVVITSVGIIKGFDGLYVEILNSWGYETHYDGLIYIKVADNESDILHNNFNMFEYNYNIEVSRKNSINEDIYMPVFIVFFILFIVACIVILFMSCKIMKLKYRNNTEPINVNSAENSGYTLPAPLSNSVVSV